MNVMKNIMNSNAIKYEKNLMNERDRWSEEYDVDGDLGDEDSDLRHLIKLVSKIIPL